MKFEWIFKYGLLMCFNISFIFIVKVFFIVLFVLRLNLYFYFFYECVEVFVEIFSGLGGFVKDMVFVSLFEIIWIVGLENGKFYF